MCTWWNFEGVTHVEPAQNGRTINAGNYCVQLEYPALVNQKQVLFQKDNAKPHTGRQTMEKIKEFNAIELFLHPAYRPDFAPSDYYLCSSMAHFPREQCFNNFDDVENESNEFFASKTLNGGAV